MAEFLKVVEDRRSASNFLSDHPISKEELNEIFKIVKLAPSAFNLQHTKYVSIFDPVIKEKLKESAYGQYKVSSASAVIVVLGDKKAYEKTAEIYESLKMLGVVNKQEYDALVHDTMSFYQTRGHEFERDEVIRNASLSAMLFMMSAKEKGWDTCPMIGFDTNMVKSVLNVAEQYEVVMMITIGKEKMESRKPRGYRKPVNEFVTYIG